MMKKGQLRPMIRRRLKPLREILRHGKYGLLVILQRFFPSLSTRNYSELEIVSVPEPGAISEPEPEVISEPGPHWRTILDGPLQGNELLLNLPTVAQWYQEMEEGRFESYLYDALGKLMPIEGATVWDVGSHIGYHTLTFAALVGPSGHVVAFEPNPYNLERIHNHLERNGELANRITLLSCALGDVDGEDNFIFSPEVECGMSSGSHLEQAYAPELATAYELFSQSKILVVRGDTLLREKQVPPPALIKVDVEGAESFVLAGAKQLLTEHKPTLLIEVHHIVAMHEILHILLPLGYHTHLIHQDQTSTSRCFVVAQPKL